MGRLKARFFKGLGFESTNAPEVRAAFLALAAAGEVSGTTQTPFGTKYTVDGYVQGPVAAAQIRTVWIIEREGSRPRFVTARPVDE